MRNDFTIISWGGIGDAIVCTPALKALKQTYPDRKIILYCNYKNHLEVFRHNPYIDSLRYLRLGAMWRYPYHLYAYLFNNKAVEHITLDFQHVAPTHLYEKSVKEIAADIFGLTLQDKNNQLFLTEAEEEKARKMLAPFRNVVILHIHSRCAINHHWKFERWGELVQRLPEYTFIQLGHSDEKHVAGAIDWRGKSSLRETFALIKYADSFVGVDSSLSHVTNAFNIPGVVIFGDSSPVYWGHENNINLYKKVPCSPCYYWLAWEPCPYDHGCMKLVTVEDVSKALVTQMRRRTEIQVPT